MTRTSLCFLAVLASGATTACRNLDDVATACSEDRTRCDDFDAGIDSAVVADTADSGADTQADTSDTSKDASIDTDAAIDADGAISCIDATCVTPPLAKCADGVTRRVFAAKGACKSGACDYSYTDTACPAGNICSGGGCSVPPSCAGGLTCGSGDSCCATIPVPGGKYSRSYDGAAYADKRYVAIVSDFELDKYEVSVGRFRKFVDAVSSGWRPAAGSGKHTHLAGGAGLNGGTEGGWDVAWSSYLPADQATWGNPSNLGCGGTTWTPSVGAYENKPVNCVLWYQAYAFCIWDGGFLPTEAEWNYAASGGTEQRIYPWGPAAPGADASHADYNCYLTGGTCTGIESIATVGTIPAGDGRWGHSELAGNMFEWTLDASVNPYNELSCSDCAYLATTAGLARVTRGGSFVSPTNELWAAARNADYPSDHFAYSGLRCARLP